MSEVRIILYGVGSIQRHVARFLLEKKSGFSVVGAVDVLKDIVGKDLDDVLGEKARRNDH